MILNRLFARKADPTQLLYETIVAAARQPRFFSDMSVPDTVDGRFDMIVLHLFLVLERLAGEKGNTAQSLTDVFFRDMDRSLREMGVGDLSVGKKVRKMAEAFYGRIKAYNMAKSDGDASLIAALQRNVYAGEDSPHAKTLADWVKNACNVLAAQRTADIVNGSVSFQ
jgi:cytochrome b pre-mRNA-processing protein 3